MSSDMLLIGGSREVHPKVKAFGLRTSLLASMAAIKDRRLDMYDRIVGLPAAASVEEWIETARLLHRLDPFGCMGGFNELTQDRAAAVGQALDLCFLTAGAIAATRQKDRDRLSTFPPEVAEEDRRPSTSGGRAPSRRALVAFDDQVDLKRNEELRRAAIAATKSCSATSSTPTTPLSAHFRPATVLGVNPRTLGTGTPIAAPAMLTAPSVRVALPCYLATSARRSDRLP